MTDQWDKLRFSSQPFRRYPPDKNRILSGALAVGWLALSVMAGGGQALIRNALDIALPLACVWFPEEIGSLTTMLPGPMSNRPITRASPAILLRIVGWIALLALTVVRVVIFVAMKP